MAEPSASSLVAAVGGVGLATLLPGLDGNAFVGAFAGAALMAISAKDVGRPSRLLYLGVSWLMGYIAAPEIIQDSPIKYTGVAAFIAAALIVTLTLQIIERLKRLDLASLGAWFTQRKR